MTEPPAAPKRLFRRAARGQDETTPWLVMGGVHIAVAIVVAIVLVGVFAIYFLAGGK